MSPYKTVVFIDVPDPDNILMLLDVINAHPREHIAVVPSARIVDLSVPRYGEDFASIRKKVGMEKMALPIESDEPQDVPESLKDWFYKDADLSDPEVRLDTSVYVQVSSLRIAQILQDRIVDPRRYTIFWDTRSLETMKRPDMRHAFQAHDFTYNFNKKEMEDYEKSTAPYRKRSVALRVELRRIIHAYTTRQIGELTLRNADDKLHNFEKLLHANKDLKNATLIIGGPFTEALTYLKRTPAPERVVAMGASIRNDRNIFKNLQFNIWKDMESAKNFFRFVQTQKIMLDLVPTECVKGTPQQACPYELHLKDYELILKKDSLLYRTIQRFKRDTDGREMYSAFDWVTAIAATDPSIFQWRKVKLQTRVHKGDEIIVVEEVHKDHGSTIRMAWDDYEYMQGQKDALKNRMRKAVRVKAT